MRFAGVFACSLALVAFGAVCARADIGIRSVAPTVASPGEPVRLTVGGYLGPRPWLPMPVVMVSAAAAPRPYPCHQGAFCTPRFYLWQLQQPPYRVLGQVSKWRVRNPRDESGYATFTFRVPKLRPGRYVLGLFCEACAAGARGSLIIDRGLTLRVRN